MKNTFAYIVVKCFDSLDLPLLGLSEYFYKSVQILSLNLNVIFSLVKYVPVPKNPPNGLRFPPFFSFLQAKASCLSMKTFL